MSYCGECADLKRAVEILNCEVDRLKADLSLRTDDLPPEFIERFNGELEKLGTLRRTMIERDILKRIVRELERFVAVSEATANVRLDGGTRRVYTEEEVRRLLVQMREADIDYHRRHGAIASCSYCAVLAPFAGIV